MTLFTPRKAEDVRPASACRAPRSTRWWMAGVGTVVSFDLPVKRPDQTVQPIRAAFAA